jgi:hypothetical protein
MDDTQHIPSTPDDTAAADASPAAAEAQAASTAQTLFKRVVDGAHEAVDGVAAKVAPVVDGIGNAGQTKDEWIDAARDAIRTHPFAAIGAALLVGAAYASLKRR